MKLLRTALTLLLAMLLAMLLALPIAAQAQTFPKLSGRVVDAAHLLNPEQVAQLTQLSEDIEKVSSRQLVVATVPDLQAYDIADYGVGLIRHWGIGQKGANNGIILIVAPKDRKVRIEVGYGLEPIMTDAYAGLIIDNVILPKFREGDMAGGIMAGASAIGDQLRLPMENAEQRAKTAVEQGKETRRKRSGGIGIFVGLFWAFVVFAILMSVIFGRGRRGRRYRGAAGDVGEILLWTAINAAMNSRGGGSSWGGGGGGGGGWGGGGGGWGGGGGFSGGGGSGGGGGASGSW